MQHESLDNASQRGYRPGEWLTLAMAAAVLVFMRAHAFDLPLETDECNYAYTATRIIEGDHLYVDVWDHQPPGVFALFVVVIALFGQDAIVIRCLAMAFSIASMLLIFHIARRSCGRVAAAMAAATFAIVSSDPGMAGEGCNREVYMNTCVLIAIALLVGSRTNRRRIVAAGLILGIGSTLKTVVASQWLGVALWLVLIRPASGRLEKKSDQHGASPDDETGVRSPGALRTLFWFSAGPACVWITLGAYFALAGRLEEAYDAVFVYNVSYSAINESHFDRLLGFFDPVFNVFESALPLWFASAVAVPGILLLCRGHLLTNIGLLLAYGIGSFISVCLPGRFWPHYYYLMLPSMILLCVALLHRLATCFETHRARQGVCAAGSAGLVLLLAFQLVHYRWLDPSDIIAPHDFYRYRQAWSQAQGLRVGEVTNPDDSVFIWGRDAGIYYYSQRKCASRFTMVGALVESSPGNDDRRIQLLEDLKRNRPRLVLIVEPEFQELKAYLQSSYVMAGRRAIDRHDRTPDKVVLAVLMDPTRPVEEIDWEWPLEVQSK